MKIEIINPIIATLLLLVHYDVASADVQAVNSCVNDKKFKYKKGNNKNCGWVGLKEERRTLLCKKNSVFNKCPSTCNDDCCKDDPKFKFKVNGKKKGCSFINNTKRVEKFCKKTKILSQCPVRCDRCFSNDNCELRQYLADTGSFGYATALYEDTMAVGAFTGDGAVYIFERKEDDSWEMKQKLTAGDEGSNINLGFSVAMRGELLVAGTIKINNYAGAAYVFERKRNGIWEETQKLVGDTAVFSRFGFRVEISPNGSVIAVTSSDDKFYFYERNDSDAWQEVQKVEAPPNTSIFGERIAMTDEMAATTYRNGSPQASDQEVIVSVVSRSNDGTWTQFDSLSLGTYPLIGPNGQVLSFLGDSFLAVGTANGSNDSSEITGTVQVFKSNESKSEFQLMQTLTASDGEAGDDFGSSITFAGDVLVVGALQGNNGSGAVYFFVLNDEGEWEEDDKLVLDDGSNNDDFGRSVSASDTTVVIGANGYNSFAGAVYVSELDCNKDS